MWKLPSDDQCLCKAQYYTKINESSKTKQILAGLWKLILCSIRKMSCLAEACSRRPTHGSILYYIFQQRMLAALAALAQWLHWLYSSFALIKCATWQTCNEGTDSCMSDRS
jgi:hypothetical protein